MAEKWPRHTDPLLLDAISGLAGLAVRAPLELTVVYFLPWFRSCARMGAGLLFPHTAAMYDPWAYAAGVEVDIFVVIVVGIVAVQVLSHWGLDHCCLKGLLGGGIAWVVFFAALSRALSTVYPSGSFLETQISILTHLIFGYVVAYAAVHLDQKRESLIPR